MKTRAADRSAAPTSFPVPRRRVRAVLADRAVDTDEPWIRALRAEVAADAEMESDRRYAALLSALRTRFGQRKLRQVIDHPERIAGAGYPLYLSEVAALVGNLGVEVSPKTIERMVDGGVVPPPPTIGTGHQVRSAFFARHVVDVLFAETFFSRPVVTEAWLTVLRGELEPTVATYLRGLPRVRVEALDLLRSTEDSR